MKRPRKRDNLKNVADIQTKFYTGIIWHNTMNWFEIGNDRIKIVTLMNFFVQKWKKNILTSFLNGSF